MGPLLFTLYVNDLPKNVNDGFISLSVDDTAICISDSSAIEMNRRLNATLNTVVHWFTRNKLSANLKKTKLMFFGTQATLSQMNEVKASTAGVTLETVHTFKYLGVMLDSLLSFNDHINYIKGKTFAKIKLLSKVSCILDRDTLLLVYKTLILPILEYGTVIYHGMSVQNADTLQKLQNAACRSILKEDMYAHIAEMHTQLNLSTLYQRRCRQIAVEVYKCVHNLGTPGCSSMLIFKHEIHELNTRATDMELLHVLRTKLKVTERDFAVTGPSIWNQIPLHLRRLENLADFKTEISNFVFC